MEKIKCSLCQSEDVTYIPNKIRNDTEGIYKMFKCGCCETHFLYPRPAREALEKYYDGDFREEVHSESYYDYTSLDKVFQNFLPEAKTRLKRVVKEIDSRDDILEIGCSVGYFLSTVADYVHMAYGTEWDRKAQAYIRDCIEKPNIKVSDNPEDFNQQFDKIFMFHVLEHIEEPVSFLENLKNILKPNGIIYIEVPNVDDVLVKTYACDAFKDFYYKKAHLYNFNETGLSYIFEHAGYQYHIDFIQRYDLSNHLYWLGKGLPGGRGMYAEVLGDDTNEAYIRALKEKKQTDTLFAKVWL